MSSESELDRIRRVYAVYDASPVESQKRDRLNPGNQRRMVEVKTLFHRLVIDCKGEHLQDTRALDVGCGTGEMLGWLADLGIRPSNLVGVDLLPQRVQTARATYPAIRFECAEAEDLPFATGSFDLVICSTLFSSILDRGVAARTARSVAAQVADGGAIVWYDIRFPSPTNPNVRAMTRSRIQRLFPTFEMHLKSVSLLPPIARRLGRATSLLYSPLATLPILRSHLVGVIVKRG